MRPAKQKRTLQPPVVRPGNWHGEILGGGTVNFGQVVQHNPGRQSVEFSYLVISAIFTPPERDFTWPGVILIFAPTPMRLVRPDAGDVRFLGRQWSGVAESVRRDLRRAMQYIPQDPLSSFDPRNTVEEIIAENLADPPGGKPARQARTAELLGEVGLGAAFLRRHPRSLSDGQRQRVAIARALASRPELIVCDEPVAALNVSVQAQVLDLVGSLQRRFGVALLFISHDLGVIEHMSDRVLVLHQGRPVEQGEPEALFAAPQHDSTRRLTAAHSALLTTTA